MTRFNAYRSYLTFTPSGFVLNDEEIENTARDSKHLRRMSSRSRSWTIQSLVTILNSFDAMFPLAPTDKKANTNIRSAH